MKNCCQNRTHPKSLSWEETDLSNLRAELLFSCQEKGLGDEFHSVSHKTVETVAAFCIELINPRLKSGVNKKNNSGFNRFSGFPNAMLRVTGFLMFIFSIGCNDMYDTGRIKPLEKSNLFADGSSARPLPQGTVPRGYAANSDLLHTGKVDGKLADLFPFAVTDSVIQRGRNRYTTFCTPCHGRLGDGGGMIVQRGFPRPKSFTTDSLRARPAGYFFDVMTNGFGKMYSYAPSIPVHDRWAIVAYIRALQLSQGARVDELSADDKSQLVKKDEPQRHSDTTK